MLQVAIVDDEEEQRKCLHNYFDRYAHDEKVSIQVKAYCNGFDFLGDFDDQFDLIFLDIRMGHPDGIEVAQEIRQTDEKVKLVFVTNLEQYAIQGYSVHAMEYIVKPLSYDMFRQKMVELFRNCEMGTPRFLTVRTGEGLLHLPVDSICYVEIVRRKLHIRTTKDTYTVYGALQDIEDTLDDSRFFRCHASVLINLHFVEKVEHNSATLCGDELPVSRQHYGELMKRLTNELGDMR